MLLLLDSKHQLIDTYELFQGTVDAASVHPREVVAACAELKMRTAVIVAHNHPSGLAEPSQADIDITRRLKVALELVDISLLDHFIIGRGPGGLSGPAGEIIAKGCGNRLIAVNKAISFDSLWPFWYKLRPFAGGSRGWG